MFKYNRITEYLMVTDIEGEQEESMEIRKSIVIDASPEVVFQAITDPNELTRWFPDQAILEPKVEGKMKFSFFKTDSEYRQMDYFPEGTITEFIPNKRLSYSWHEPNIPDFPNTVVTWELERIKNNKTRLNLLHTGFKADETAKKHNEGWSHFLTELKKYCEKRNKQS
jgi:uncharacterized protein YndB with AHSA1/START domain